MLPGIRQYCCRSKLQRVSPCWTASNPPLTPLPCMWSRQGLVLHDRAEGGTFHRLCLWRTAHTQEPSRSFPGRNRHGHFDIQPMGGVCSHKAGKATALPCSLPLLLILECASRQTPVTYQHDIVQLRCSCLPQSNENFRSMLLSFIVAGSHSRVSPTNTNVCDSVNE